MGMLIRSNSSQLEGAWQTRHKHPVIIIILTRDSQFRAISIKLMSHTSSSCWTGVFPGVVFLFKAIHWALWPTYFVGTWSIRHIILILLYCHLLRLQNWREIVVINTRNTSVLWLTNEDYNFYSIYLWVLRNKTFKKNEKKKNNNKRSKQFQPAEGRLLILVIHTDSMIIVELLFFNVDGPPVISNSNLQMKILIA